MKLLGIYRGERYSPNMVSNDAKILDAVADELRVMGHEVDTLNEDVLETMQYDVRNYDRVFGMMRNAETINRLMERNEDLAFVNPLSGILNCIERVALTRVFINKGISIPQCVLCSENNTTEYGKVTLPAWVKRGYGYTEIKEDTSYVSSIEELDSVVKSYRERGINSYMLQQHMKGDLIKFYGVEGSGFFKWDYASKCHSKFGLEAINSKEQGYPFSVENLKALADKASRALGVPVYGGDCVVDAEGHMYIIDFNDWPSFSHCRETAAKAIAAVISSYRGG